LNVCKIFKYNVLSCLMLRVRFFFCFWHVFCDYVIVEKRDEQV